mgnify:CR=1 FL=1
MNNLGKFVRLKRQIKGYSQENLAKAIGKSQYWVSKFENGQKIADDSTLLKICKFLCIDKFDLVNYDQTSFINNNEEEIILNFVKLFQDISEELDKLNVLKNQIQEKFFKSWMHYSQLDNSAA